MRRYDWKAILKNLRDRDWEMFIISFLKKFYSVRGNRGAVRVTEEDWDYLIVLDACRYDIFEEVNWLKGDLEKKISLGSSSQEWLARNFKDYYGDTVYITANGFVHPFQTIKSKYIDMEFTAKECFHDINPVYMDEDNLEAGATKPEVMTEEAIKWDEKYPNKRKIIHYVQPHGPYIGDIEITEDSNLRPLSEKYSRKELLAAYKANLVRVLEAVEDLIQNIEGKIVITADHGESLGEKGIWNHPEGIYTKELVEVPWLEIEKGERPKITEEIPSDLDV